MAPDDLGIRIRRARERLDMSQAQLAAAVNRSVRAVGTWERGEAVPRNVIGALEVVLRTDLTSSTAPDPVVEAIRGLRDLPAPIAEKLVERYRELTAPAAPPAVPATSNGNGPHSASTTT